MPPVFWGRLVVMTTNLGMVGFWAYPPPPVPRGTQRADHGLGFMAVSLQGAYLGDEEGDRARERRVQGRPPYHDNMKLCPGQTAVFTIEIPHPGTDL